MSEAEKKIGDLRVTVQRETCIGSGNCVKVAPDVFELDDEDVASFRSGAENADRARVIEACSVCPVEALVAKDASGQQLVP